MDGKQVELDSKFEPKKCQNDGTRNLNDDIIIEILSCLPLKEAGRTSVLSSRWINLWKHNPHLNFDLDSALKSKITDPQELRGLEEFVEEETRKYVDWVNTVLQCHKAPILEEFRVHFELNRSHQDEITRWLEFAFAKKVRRLELDLNLGPYTDRPTSNCSFSEELLTRIDFQSLRELSLKYVNVTSEAIEYFLQKCPLLEKLVVIGTVISNLQVCGESLMLKHLELDNLYFPESVKVCAPNLLSLTVPLCKGLSLENVPMLVEVSLKFVYSYPINRLFSVLACCISRLEILHLKLLCTKKSVEDCKSLVNHKFPELPKLKKLFIQYRDTGGESLIGLTSLITASPNLHIFSLEVCGYCRSTSKKEIPSSMYDLSRSKKEIPSSMKIFKFGGYYGRVCDVELVMYISENYLAIEKIIIDPSVHDLFQKRKKKEQALRKIAKKQLEGKLPKHINLVVL